MVKKIEKIKSWQIILFSALFLVVLFVGYGSINYARETSARKNGTLQEKVVDVYRFQFKELGYAGGEGLKVFSHDPQLLMETPQAFTSLKFYMESSMHPGEVVLYYSTEKAPGYSEHRRLWATSVDGEPNWYLIETPVKNVTALRLDPTMYIGNELIFGDFIFNREKSFGDFFEITTGRVYELIVYTAIISSCLRWLQEFITKKFE
ncbi:MAG: hypothetical protein IJ410_09025 [Oscillospiraceae bacterium]|nr:hypothetical protein [Oscillospiraceae bacterium]